MVERYEDVAPIMALAETSFTAQGLAAGPARTEPFFGLIGSVIVAEVGPFRFDGAIPRAQALAAWTWVVRDLSPDLRDISADAFEQVLPALLDRMRDELARGGTDPQAGKRLDIRIGDAEAIRRLPQIINALQVRGLLGKARDFGRASGAMSDDDALAQALAAIPLGDERTASLLFQAMIGEVRHPHRLIVAASRRAGGAVDSALIRAGFGPLVGAVLASAQDQLQHFFRSGAFADMDRTCRAIERFHRLLRAVGSYIDLGRLNAWSATIAALTKLASERIEPRLREVAPDVSMALRPARDGADRLDSDRLLAALSGMYLLVTLRDCRESLALNALVDEIWLRTGQVLEAYVPSILDMVRADPANQIAGARLDAALKMAELRFGAEYAGIIRRARDGEARRHNTASG